MELRSSFSQNQLSRPITHTLSPEVTFLLMVCTLDLSIEKRTQITQFLSQRPPNWDRLHALATRHRLTPFLYRTLQKIPATPESFLTILQKDCRITATDNLLKLHQYRVLDTLLTENSIEHIPMKGIHLAEQCYPDSSLRISGDIDVLISKEDVFKTIHLLQTHQYHLSKKHNLHWQQGEQVILADIFEVSLFKPFFNGSNFDIDLHWKIMGFNQHYALFDFRYIHSQPDFSTELTIILLVTHHGINNIWQQIYYINDLYFAIHKKVINWPWLLHELQKQGFDQVLLAGLYWCQQIWDLNCPSFIHELITSTKVRLLAEAYSKNWEAIESSEFSNLILKQLTFFIKAQTQFSKKLRIGSTFLSSRIFRFSLFKIGKHLIYIPKEAGFITLFIRAFQSLYRLLPTHR